MSSLSPPIRYNLASSTGPSWTLGDLLALGDGAGLKELGDLRLSYAPPQGSDALRQQVAALHDVDPDWVVITTGASEALVRAVLPRFGARRVDHAAVSRHSPRCPSWRARGD